MMNSIRDRNGSPRWGKDSDGSEPARGTALGALIGIPWRLRITLLVIVAVAAACSKTSQTKPPKSNQTSGSASPAVASQPSGTNANPRWVARSRKWPFAMNWTLDTADEIMQDDLLFRLKGSAIQSFIGGKATPNRPIMCFFEMTLRPVPDWSLARGLVLDSVSLYDPVHKVTLQTLPMLSSERTFEGGTLRTRFSNNLAKMYTPQVDDGQLLDPTVYFTWDRRTLIVKAQPFPIHYLTKMNTESPYADTAFHWGPEKK
ncbi:MAG: hypothetical protein HY304_01105 [candidate division Zixibacteria bacterium]|nr:hypothetical protein [candidate division Zixibacteria bacterium]